MSRSILMAAAFLVMAAACGGGSSGSVPPTSEQVPAGSPTESIRVSPEPRPTAVPPAATPIVETSTLGEITRQAKETPRSNDLRRIESGVCEDNLLKIQTSLETIYADLTCDKFDNAQFAEIFSGHDAALVLEAGPDRYRIIIETIDGAQAEFTPDSIWIV